MNKMDYHKVAEYDVERLPVYASSGAGRGTEAKLTVWVAKEPSDFTGTVYWCVSIGGGKLHPCHSARDHETASEFHFGMSKPQRWAKA